MPTRVTVATYLRGEETNQPRELVYGFVREPPAPTYGHQAVVTNLGALLHRHVRRRRLGRVVVAPVDVVLDQKRALVLQPDLVYVSTERARIVTDRVFGAPDLVVEVLSMGTAARDRTQKLEWYRHYGVRECWLVDPFDCSVEVRVLSAPGAEARRFEDGERVRSVVLPRLRLAVTHLFD
jgi:Uma2 family endonuclease